MQHCGCCRATLVYRNVQWRVQGCIFPNTTIKCTGNEIGRLQVFSRGAAGCDPDGFTIAYRGVAAMRIVQAVATETIIVIDQLLSDIQKRASAGQYISSSAVPPAMRLKSRHLFR